MSALDDLIASDLGQTKSGQSALDSIISRDTGSGMPAVTVTAKRGLPSEQGAAQAPLTRTDRVLQGVRDPIDGAAQLLTKILPDSVVKAGNSLNNFLADKTGLVGRLPEGGVDQQVRENDAAYQKSRGVDAGFDGYRTLGNVLSPANLALAARVPTAATALGRAGIGAAVGAGSGLMSPVTDGDFAAQKGLQALGGAGGGAALSGIASGLARVISPNASTNPALAALKAEGVAPTIGQSLGGRWNTLEEKMMSLPILGDAIANARGNALKTFNQAAINRATAPVGTKVTAVGQDGVREAGDALSNSYNAALSKVSDVTLDSQFSNDLGQLHGMAQNLTGPMRDKFNGTLKEVVMRKVSPQGSILGSSYKEIDSELGELASRYGKSTVASEGELGDALSQMQSLLRQQMVRSNPQVAQEINATDKGWANLVRVEGAAKSAKNADGIFTPAQLNMAAQTADDSVRKRAISRGTALMQDLGNAGQNVIGNKVPNSFTTDRALIAGGSLGSYLINPAIPLGLLGGAAMYTRPMQGLLNGAISARPQAAQPIADALRKISPLLLPLGTQMGAGLLEH